MENFERHIAEQFINYTSKNIFLTGRAGTGKTTFLKEIVANTTKNAIVIAPTGVAAINAGGVTIHSMFQLPLTAFVPSNDEVDLNVFNNRYSLARHLRYRTDRRKLIENLELLIIDEISMVRADLLDAIDFILRTIRKNTLPFGGVQLLVIGDLFQLSPIVKPNILPMLQRYYKSPFFFDAHAWALSDPIKIELKKIYRQQDQEFIDILNNVRLGIRREEDITRLNQNFSSNPEDEGILTLTTHNANADQINIEEMKKLSAPRRSFDAEISGKFNESAYPTAEKINLKKGAQVMFLRNHSEGIYFNGKIGIVEEFEEDTILVRSIDDHELIRVEMEDWKNTKYTLDKETNTIKQEEIGRFSQYPLKLAWAITVHKSQGLTFDKVSVDLSQTFASGQMYVALSRCRSLDGLILRSKVIPNNIITDQKIISYYAISRDEALLQDLLQDAKQLYSSEQLLKAFQFAYVIPLFEDWKTMITDKAIPQKGKALVAHNEVLMACNKLSRVGHNFQSQLRKMLVDRLPSNEILDRSLKAIKYFTHEYYQDTILPLEKHIEAYKIKKSTTVYIRLLNEIRNDLWTIVERLYQLEFHDVPIHPKAPAYIKTNYYNPEKKNKKAKKGATQDLTFELYNTGRSPEEIAEARSLKISTIHSHLGKFVANGTLALTQLMDQKKIDTLVNYYQSKGKETPLADIINNSPIDISYAEMKWILSYIELNK